jgi:hypothetical protein
MTMSAEVGRSMFDLVEEKENPLSRLWRKTGF